MFSGNVLALGRKNREDQAGMGSSCKTSFTGSSAGFARLFLIPGVITASPYI